MSTLFSTLMSILNHVQRARLFGIGFSNKEILAILTPKHNVVICVRTLKRLCRKLSVQKAKSDQFGGRGRLHANRNRWKWAESGYL